MEHSYKVETQSLVVYENWVEVSDEQINEYRASDPDYAELTNEEIVKLMYEDGELDIDDSQPIDWYDETVLNVYEYSY